MQWAGVGFIVGAAVGVNVGAAVGVSVGSFVGVAEGYVVGYFVGDGVGGGVVHCHSLIASCPDVGFSVALLRNSSPWRVSSSSLDFII
jgi:outer membrane lipoprotein SlyB